MLSAVIVDDEIPGVESLEILLKKYCPTVVLKGIAYSAEEAEKIITSVFPDLVFMDIEMPNTDGFEVLHQLKEIPFHVIFTTAHEHYAIKAIKHSAADYLLKPIDPDELILAIQKCENTKKQTGDHFIQIDSLIQKLSQSAKPQKFAVKTIEGMTFINPNDVIRLEAASNYTTIFMVGGKKIVASKTLKEFEETLTESGFFRVHNTHLINLNYVDKYKKGEGGYVIMTDASEVEVSRTKKNELLALLLEK